MTALEYVAHDEARRRLGVVLVLELSEDYVERHLQSYLHDPIQREQGWRLLLQEAPVAFEQEVMNEEDRMQIQAERDILGQTAVDGFLDSFETQPALKPSDGDLKKFRTLHGRAPTPTELRQMKGWRRRGF